MRCAECRWWGEEESYAWCEGFRPCSVDGQDESEYFVGGGDSNDGLYTGPEFFCKHYAKRIADVERT